jgi:hypothetical protein
LPPAPEQFCKIAEKDAIPGLPLNQQPQARIRSPVSDLGIHKRRRLAHGRRLRQEKIGFIIDAIRSEKADN